MTPSLSLSLPALVALLALSHAAQAAPAPSDSPAITARAPGSIKLLGRSVDQKNEFGKRELASSSRWTGGLVGNGRAGSGSVGRLGSGI